MFYETMLWLHSLHNVRKDQQVFLHKVHSVNKNLLALCVDYSQHYVSVD